MGAEVESRIGKYDVLSKLGEGGMGVVYKAKDPLIDRIVAIKKMTGAFAEDNEARERFLREARAVGRLQHANIVTIYELGVEGNSPYMVMEFLEGRGLDSVISARTPLPLVQKLDYMVQVCHALHYAHEHQIVHRDVKPANVIVMTGGAQVKLVDFGIARAGNSGMTRTGIAIGTTSYMSPEQIEADKGLDRRSDVFSAGVMLFELLTYSLPFPGTEPIAIAIKILREPHPPLSSYLQDYPPELDQFLERALAKDRDERYSTAEEFAMDMSQLCERMRRDMVGQNLVEAQAHFQRKELAQARDLLTEIIKVESQHTEARQLLHEVQQLMLKQERSAQVLDFRFAAEAAVGQDRYEDALGLIDQAIRIDKTNDQLAQYRDLILQGIERHEKVRGILAEADGAEKTEDLQSAEKFVEQALEVDPTDTQARMMMVGIKRRLGRQSREAEIKELSDLARRDIASHRFTGAHDVIRRLEAIDPALDEISKLKELAVTEHRKEEEQRKFVEEELAKANKHVADGKLQAALNVLQEAIKRYPDEKRLTAAIDSTREQMKSASAAPPVPARPPQTRMITSPVAKTVAARAGAGAAAAAPAKSPAAATPARRPVVAAPPPKSNKGLIIGIVVAVVIVLGSVGGYLALRPKTETGTASTATTQGTAAGAVGASSLQINAVPFGKVKSITDSKGKSIDIADPDTPVLIDNIASGAYEIVVVGPDGQTEQKHTVSLHPGKPTYEFFEFQKIDPKKIVDAY